MKAVVNSEYLLLSTYNVTVPYSTDFTNLTLDLISNDILKLFHPVLLSDVFPARTGGDGNCFYRAASSALTSSQSSHMLLRLLTAVEVMSNPMYYDTKHKKFVDLIKDNRIIVSDFGKLCHDTVRPGSYSGMIHFYALSAAMNRAIRSYYPPHLSAEFISEPHTRKIVGRCVNESDVPMFTLMWTQMNHYSNQFVPNHFVSLIPCTSVSVISDRIVVDDSDVPQSCIVDELVDDYDVSQSCIVDELVVDDPDLGRSDSCMANSENAVVDDLEPCEFVNSVNL